MQESFGDRLRRLLEERHYGKPATKMAKEAGVDYATLQKALEGSTTPRYPTMVKLAEYCGVSYEYLQTGEGSPEPPPADLEQIRERVAELQQLVERLAEDVERQASDGKS